MFPKEREMNVEVQIDQEQKMTAFVSPRPFIVQTRRHLLIIQNDCKSAALICSVLAGCVR